jgi:predicted ATPase/class 3 adenylate cyclase/Tfp pilus assembly protein PilF
MDVSQAPPLGTVTLLSTDIVGSSAAWERLGEAFGPAVEAHYAILNEAIARFGGYPARTEGDSCLAAFDRASDAVRAAVAAQQGLQAHPWPPEVSAVQVRIGLHTGEPRFEDGSYSGPPVNRATRLQSAAHGGQILLSAVTHELAHGEMGEALVVRSLGRHRLKDLAEAETLYELQYPGMPDSFPPPRTATALPNNLPVSLTRFIGREAAIAEVKEWLGSTRLLTLTGAGGCGKTRLALQVAAELLEEYPDGVWLVELEALSDPALVTQRVAAVLGLREEPGRPLLPTLCEHLQSQRILLVLDNCEHLVAACARLVEALLRACPHLSLLVTSREVLAVPGEMVWRVPSLSLPDDRPTTHDQRPTTEVLLRYEAVRLFMDRAVASQPHFTVTAQNATAVVQVCRRLDGIPLAIELAAARVKLLSVEQIASRLDDRFRLLTGGNRTALPRHQTLRATMDWSYELLSEQERLLLRRLSVFVGGFMLEAAEAVCAGAVDSYPLTVDSREGDASSLSTVNCQLSTEEILDLLTQLVDKSLVVMEEHGGEAWYRLLETIRQYGAEQLRDSGEGVELALRHHKWYVALAGQASAELAGADQGRWLDRLEREHDNLRAALNGLPAANELDAAMRLGAELARFWRIRGYLSEGRERLAALLAAAERTAGERSAETVANRAKVVIQAGALAYYQADYAAARMLYEEGVAIYRGLDRPIGLAAALNNLGNVAWVEGDLPAARALYEEGLELRRSAGDTPGVATSLNNLGMVAQYESDYASAQRLYEEALALRRTLGDPLEISDSLNNLGIVTYLLGELSRARTLYEESLAIKRDLGDKWGTAGLLSNLGFVTLRQGHPADAEPLCRESLSLRRELGDRNGIAEALEGLAGVAGARGEAVRAARLFGAAEALREAIGAPIPSGEQSEHDRLVATARTGADEAAFAVAWEEGRALTLEQAMDEADVRCQMSDVSEDRSYSH